MQKAIPGWQNATEVQWREACRREAVIRPLAEQEKVSRAAAIAAADELGMSRAMVYRLVASCRERGDALEEVLCSGPEIEGHRLL